MSGAPGEAGDDRYDEVTDAPQTLEVSVGARFRAKNSMRLVDVQKTDGGYEAKYVEINAEDVIVIEGQPGEGEPYVKVNVRGVRCCFKAKTLKSADWEKLVA